MKKLTAFVITLFVAGTLSVANAKSRNLNPQPLPPGMKMGSKVQVNPQPLPPGTANIRHSDGQDRVALNPQPLPPAAPLNPGKTPK